MWLATLSSYRTCTDYSLPVSRRTAKNSGHYPWCINPLDRGGQGLPPKVVQVQLGHSSIVMTMDTYGHLFRPDKDADKRLADAERALLG